MSGLSVLIHLPLGRQFHTRFRDRRHFKTCSDQGCFVIMSFHCSRLKAYPLESFDVLVQTASELTPRTRDEAWELYETNMKTLWVERTSSMRIHSHV